MGNMGNKKLNYISLKSTGLRSAPIFLFQFFQRGRGHFCPPPPPPTGIGFIRRLDVWQRYNKLSLWGPVASLTDRQSPPPLTPKRLFNVYKLLEFPLPLLPLPPPSDVIFEWPFRGGEIEETGIFQFKVTFDLVQSPKKFRTIKTSSK